MLDEFTNALHEREIGRHKAASKQSGANFFQSATWRKTICHHQSSIWLDDKDPSGSLKRVLQVMGPSRVTTSSHRFKGSSAERPSCNEDKLRRENWALTRVGDRKIKTDGRSLFFPPSLSRMSSLLTALAENSRSDLLFLIFFFGTRLISEAAADSYNQAFSLLKWWKSFSCFCFPLPALRSFPSQVTSAVSLR